MKKAIHGDFFKTKIIFYLFNDKQYFGIFWPSISIDKLIQQFVADIKTKSMGFKVLYSFELKKII